ncbi:MAG TPA: beta-ketoacyl synthase N-terminal-like domain-containing protein [Oscillatoriaceae cyanobacterium]
MSVILTAIGTVMPVEGARTLPESLDLKARIGGKGLRSVDRLGLMTLAACQDAMDDALAPDGVGVVLGTAFGALRSVTDFFTERLREGPRLVTPSNFGSIVMNAAAGQVAVRHGFTALNATLTSGSASGLDALGLAADLLRAGRASALLAGGADDLSPDAQRALEALGWTAAGYAAREAAVVLRLEREDLSRSPGLARLVAHATAFDPGVLLGRAPSVEVAKRVLNGVAQGAKRAIAGRSGLKALDAATESTLAGFSVQFVDDALAATGPLAVLPALEGLGAGERVVVYVASPSGHHSALLLEGV